MKCSLGIDLGTGSVKALLVELETGTVRGVGQASYGYEINDGQRAEQNPNVLKRGSYAAIRAALQTAGVKGRDVAAIGFSGQMHGMVLLGQRGSLLTNVVTWEDRRCDETVLDEIRRTGGRLVEKSGCGIATGFAGPTLYAIKKTDPKLFRRARTLLLPTDWIRREIADEDGFVTDTSNGSSSGFFDTANRRWNGKLLDRLGIPPGIMPDPVETTTVSGTVKSSAARRTGLAPGTPVAVGGGDQPLSMIGSGIAGPKDGVLINIGTGSQIATVSAQYRKKRGLITFCFPCGGYSVLGAGLAGGASLRWWRDRVQEAASSIFGASVSGNAHENAYANMSAAAAQSPPGSRGLYFVPYLSGTRTEPSATASLAGLRADHSTADISRAIMEGVCYELYDYFLRFRTEKDKRLVGAGGGLSSPVWRQITADIFNLPLRIPDCQEQAALGAALVGAVGAGAFRNIAHAVRAVRSAVTTTRPRSGNVAEYAAAWPEMQRLLRQG